MYEAPQMGNKKLPYSGQLYVFEDYIVFVEKSKVPTILQNKNRDKIELKIMFKDVHNCILQSRSLHRNMSIQMKNYSKQTLPTIHQFHKMQDQSTLTIIRSHIDEKLREISEKANEPIGIQQQQLSQESAEKIGEPNESIQENKPVQQRIAATRSEEEIKEIEKQLELDQATINENPFLNELAGDGADWKVNLLQKKVFEANIKSVSDLVFSFTIKKDSKTNKLKFIELIQKNVRKRDKNIKSCISETTKIVDISGKDLNSLETLHKETLDYLTDKANKPEKFEELINPLVFQEN